MDSENYLVVEYNEHTSVYAPKEEEDGAIPSDRFYCAMVNGQAVWTAPESKNLWEVHCSEEEAVAENIVTHERCLATVWEVYVDEDENRYFYNNLTKESTWTPPLWIDLIDPSSAAFVYFYCHETGESAWLPPQEVIDEFSQYNTSSPEELTLSMRLVQEYCTLQSDKKRDRSPEEQAHPEEPGKLVKLQQHPSLPPLPLPQETSS